MHFKSCLKFQLLVNTFYNYFSFCLLIQIFTDATFVAIQFVSTTNKNRVAHRTVLDVRLRRA